LEKILKVDSYIWGAGDLVKIRWYEDGIVVPNAFGVVVSTFYNEKQIKIFPSVRVYNLRSGAIEEHYVEDLELISESHA
jgi:hypothetical protein